MSASATAAGASPVDRAVIEGQLGRKPRGLVAVAVRCPFGYPAVVESAPVLDQGEPNPTLLYLTCPAVDAVVSRIEGTGGVRDLRERSRTEGELGARLARLTAAYQRRRQALWSASAASGDDAPRLEAGIGGPKDAGHASCLHAYAAAMLAGMSGYLEVEDPDVSEEAREAWALLLPPVEASWCTDHRCTRWALGEKRAVIDVGTISVRLLIADIVDGRPWTLVRKAQVTRLGQGLVVGGRLDHAARRRTADAVGKFAREARVHGVERVAMVGTSAARDAADGQDFISSLAREHGLDAEILSGAREAELAYDGVSLDVDDAVVLDVGGGSTELVTRMQDGGLAVESLQLGASRETEKWIKRDPPTSEELGHVGQEAAEAFNTLRDRFGAAATGPGLRTLVGVAGTITTLAALSAGLEAYDDAVIHLRKLAREEIAGLLVHLAGLTIKQRAALPCVQAGRAPVIVAGAAIVLAAMRELGYEELVVSERDLLDGLILADR